MNEDAFEQAVRRHKDSVHGFATRMLRDRDEALDVAQESLVRLWEHRKRVRDDGARAWLMRTAHNLCIDRIRKRKTRAEVAEGEAIVDLQAAQGPGPGRLAESGELGAGLEAALDRLDPVDRAVILFREVQGLPYQEIAEALGMPLGTVKARIHRSREKLRDALTRAGLVPGGIEEGA